MPSLLTTDSERFSSEYSEAKSFLLAAHLRKITYTAALKMEKGTSLNKERMRGLLSAPACKEPFFLKLLENDTPNTFKAFCS